jgi:hypothetical protein
MLKSITLTPTSVNGATILTVSVNASFSSSSIGFISLELDSPNFASGLNGQILRIDNLTYISANNWEGSVNYTINNHSGTWFVNQIAIGDGTNTDDSTFYIVYEKVTSQNSVNYVINQNHSDPPVYTNSGFPFKSISVTESNPDTTYPVLTGLSRAPAVITGSGTINITITATDTGTGIPDDNNVIAVLESPTGDENDNIQVDFSRSSGNNFTGSTDMDGTNAGGTWNITNIRIEDNSGNYRTYYIDTGINTIYYLYSDHEDGSSPVATVIPIITFTKN